MDSSCDRPAADAEDRRNLPLVRIPDNQRHAAHLQLPPAQNVCGSSFVHLLLLTSVLVNSECIYSDRAAAAQQPELPGPPEPTGNAATRNLAAASLTASACFLPACG